MGAVSKRHVNHVVWDNSVEGTKDPPMRYEAMRLRCRHCGDVYDLAVPVSLRVAAAVFSAYGSEHRWCRKPKPTEPAEPTP